MFFVFRQKPEDFILASESTSFIFPKSYFFIIRFLYPYYKQLLFIHPPDISLYGFLPKPLHPFTSLYLQGIRCEGNPSPLLHRSFTSVSNSPFNSKIPDFQKIKIQYIFKKVKPTFSKVKPTLKKVKPTLKKVSWGSKGKTVIFFYKSSFMGHMVP